MYIYISHRKYERVYHRAVRKDNDYNYHANWRKLPLPG